MGTSSSNSGPKGKTSLLPKWAQGGGQGASPGTPAGAPTDAPQSSPPSQKPGSGATPPPAQAQPAAFPSPKLSSASWTLARRAMTTAAKAGATVAGLTSAGRRYVSAKGGAKKA